MRESSLVVAIRVTLGGLPDLVIWRNQTGVAQYWDGAGKQMFVPFGLCKGSADLIGILSPSGRMVALEVKTDRGRTSREQKMFLELVRKMGGFGCVVRSVGEALEAVDRARKGWTA